MYGPLWEGHTVRDPHKTLKPFDGFKEGRTALKRVKLLRLIIARTYMSTYVVLYSYVVDTF